MAISGIAGLAGALEAVGKAVIEANLKHGPLTTDPVRMCAILTRECAEAMNEALLMTAPAANGDDALVRAKRVRAMYDELAQVAATAMLAMENLRRVT